MKHSTRDWKSLAKAIENNEVWKTHGATLAGPSAGYVGHNGSGRLPSEYVGSVNRADYIVWSYHTPIAWRDRDSKDWTIPATKYSVTTTKHQGTARVAISQVEKKWEV